MSQLEKKKQRLLSYPKDYTYTEAKSLLSSLGYIEDNVGKTTGSAVRFYRERDMAIIRLHKPHPGDELKMYAVDLLIDNLKNRGDL